MLHTRTYLPGFRSIVVLLVLPGLVSLSSPTLASSLTSWLAPTFSWAAGVSVFSTITSCSIVPWFVNVMVVGPAFTDPGALGAAGGARGTLGARASCQRDHDQTGDKQRHDLVVAWHRTNPSSVLRIERNRIAPPESSGGSSFRSGLTLRTAAGACTGRTAQDGRDSSPLPAYGSGAKPTSAASGGRAAKSRALARLGAGG